MGLNAEMVRIVADLRPQLGHRGLTVIEFGAQDLCAAPEVVDHILSGYGLPAASEPTSTARAMYQRLGFNRYDCIDATGGHGAHIFDLNCDLVANYGFTDRFDLVTNLGTAEHCFNQAQVFKNMHDVCREGGFMVHAAPCAGNVNHGFYNYHPRFFADLAAANGYELMRLAFTVDYTPTLYSYTPANFKRYDSRDLLLYVVLKRVSNGEFKIPFDGMFASENALKSYHGAGQDPLTTVFAPYLKGGSWEGTKGFEELPWWRQGRAARIFARLRR